MKYKIAIALSVILIVSIIYLLVDTIPPYDLTISNMLETKMRIFQYVRTNGELPQNLDYLPKIDGHSNSVLDGWGRPIIFSIDDRDGIIYLKSLGESGDPTCKNSKPCIIRSFKVKTEKGEWVNELTDWLDKSG
jgi:hypothetical protein